MSDVKLRELERKALAGDAEATTAEQKNCGGYPEMCAVFKGPVCEVCLCCQLCAEAMPLRKGICVGCGK